MLKLNPEIFSDLYDKDLIAYGTGNMAKRMIPYLVQDPNIRLHGVTNSRVTTEDEGTFLETGLPIRSVHAWAERYPDATILLTAFNDADKIMTACRNEGFHNFEYVTWEKMSVLTELDAEATQAQQSKILEHLCLANELHDTHKASFSEFKACNRGKAVVVVGTGPTLNYYMQITGAPHIGVNASFLKDELTLDYYFITHYILEWCKRLKEYDFIKFFNIGIKSRRSKDQIPEYIIEENNGRRYFSLPMTPFTQIHTNLEYYPLMSYDSIIFQAIHFALYTRPKKLLLVGCDCTLSGHFYDKATNVWDGDGTALQWAAGYRNIKKFVAIHYPDTEIISVNPIGLKGIFHDVYTESYLDAHPGLSKSDCEILDPIDFE